jgi:hypothetical protein
VGPDEVERAVTRGILKAVYWIVLAFLALMVLLVIVSLAFP